MSWLAVSDGRRVYRDLDLARQAHSAILPTGSLLVEVTFNAEQGQRQNVIFFEHFDEWFRKFRMTIGAKGDLMVEHQQGAITSYGLVRFERPEQGECLRITMSWDAPNRIGVISVENLDTGGLAQKVLDEPNPWPLADIRALHVRAEGVELDPGLTLLAASDAIEPVAIRGGFAAGTLVDTTTGPRPIETLKTGDHVQTSEHGMQPVRKLVSHEVPTIGRFAPVHLRPPFFGMSRDIKVAPDHRLMVAGADAEYLFGADSVLIEARHLEKFVETGNRPKVPTIRYVQVLLDAHVVLSASGAWGESFFIGNLADDPMRLATSVLSGVPSSDLPRHTRTANTELHGYEAMVLLSALSA